MLVAQGEYGRHLGVTNKGYVWATNEPNRTRHFRLIGADKKTELRPDQLADTDKVYLRASRNNNLLQTYGRTQASKRW